MWEKIMKEVKNLRYAGPFKKPPFKNFMQSPIGLVPKGSEGLDTRLIFHLSYDFPGSYQSFNKYTPDEWCSVQYHDLDEAVQSCIELLNLKPGATIWLGITDLKSAFRIVPGARRFWPYLMMMAVDPLTGQKMYFLDKALPFGAGISCSLFQDFSDSLVHIFKFVLGRRLAQRC